MTCNGPINPIPVVCTPDAVIAGIIRQLGSGSPCDNTLVDVIPALWELVFPEACSNTHLQSLLVKREAILYLMGCEAYSVDAYDRNRQMDGITVADSFSDVRTQSQSTGNSTRFSKGHGETRYDEKSTARSHGEMDRHDRADETGDGTSFYRDDGRGNGFNNSQSTNEIENLDQTLDMNENLQSSTERGGRTDCNYEYSTSRTDGAAVGIPPLASFSFNGSGNEWRKFTRTRAADDDAMIHETRHYHTREVRDERRGQGTHDWLSQFQADIFWRDHDFEIRTAHDRTDNRRHAEAHAQGDGDGMSEEKSEAHNAAQGTAKSEMLSGTKRTMRRADNLTLVALANSQRFKNLQNIYDQLTTQIIRAKRRLRARAPALIATMPCNCTGCCQCGPSYRRLGCDIISRTQTGLGGADMLWST